MLSIRSIAIIALFFLSIPHAVWAAIPLRIHQESLFDITTIAEPTTQYFFYGQLDNFPHTYEFSIDEAIELSVSLENISTSTSDSRLSGLIVKEVPETGRVQEISRLQGSQTTWVPYFNHGVGGTLLKGPSFSQHIEPGTYRIEVHTPNNLEKYILLVGREEREDVGYFETLHRLATFASFNDQSRFSLIYTPTVYIPLLILILASGAFVYVRRRHRVPVDL